MSGSMRLGKIGARRLLRGLPYDAEVEYLESTGTQWIDWGTPFPVNGKVEIEIMQHTYLGYGVCGFGSGTGGNDRYQLLFESATQGLLRGDGNILINYNYGRFTVAIIDRINKQMIVAGETVSAAMNTAPSSRNFYLFNSSASNSKAAVRIRYGKLWDGATIIRDSVPVRFTNEMGKTEGAMYDRVTKKLFRNQGTGAFVIGPDITAQIGGGGG